uniref:apolipoprotein L3-like isoform X2 n=1 Tax=Myodes glareolus TaxID=447135 RepID=UPI002021AFAA|nr:apolipoprotein L3-like isoform X2 [Myodes glareolus]
MASELKSIVDKIAATITNKLCRDDLKLLITEDGAWKTFVVRAALSSEEEAALRDALKKHLAQEPTDENGETEKRQQKENFLKEFPGLKRKLEEHIRKLRYLAVPLDQEHRGCTTSHTVSGPTDPAATIAGLALAPFTGGLSLMITAAGRRAAVTGATSFIVEKSIRAYEGEARRLVKASMDILNKILKIMPLILFQLCSAGWQLFGAWKTLREHIQAIRAGETTSFKITAKTESAEEPQELTNDLEEKLREFEQLHKALQ